MRSLLAEPIIIASSSACGGQQFQRRGIYRDNPNGTAVYAVRFCKSCHRDLVSSIMRSAACRTFLATPMATIRGPHVVLMLTASHHKVRGVSVLNTSNAHRYSCIKSLFVTAFAVPQKPLDAYPSDQRSLHCTNQTEAYLAQSNTQEPYQGHSNDKCGWQPTPVLGSRHDCSGSYIVSAQEQSPLCHQRF